MRLLLKLILTKTSNFINLGRSVDVHLVLDLVRHYSGRSVDVNLVTDLVRNYSGRSVDVKLVFWME